jgi:HSP20 family protein
MAETTNKLPVQSEEKSENKGALAQTWRPFESLRREVDRLFEEFERGSWRLPFRRSVFDADPFWRRELTLATNPAIDIIEKDNAYQIIAELPGLDEKNIEVKMSNGTLTIRGEKQEDKEEKKKGYYLRERHFGSFERHFRIPDGVDADKIDASFKKGVLTVTLPKTPEAQKPEKRIEVKAG